VKLFSFRNSLETAQADLASVETELAELEAKLEAARTADTSAGAFLTAHAAVAGKRAAIIALKDRVAALELKARKEHRAQLEADRDAAVDKMATDAFGKRLKWAEEFDAAILRLKELTAAIPDDIVRTAEYWEAAPADAPASHRTAALSGDLTISPKRWPSGSYTIAADYLLKLLGARSIAEKVKAEASDFCAKVRATKVMPDDEDDDETLEDWQAKIDRQLGVGEYIEPEYVDDEEPLEADAVEPEPEPELLEEGTAA
jgi:hypothetical protein